MPTNTFPFSDTSEYTFDSDKISIASGAATLKLISNPSQAFTEDFSSSAGFVFTSSLTEFVGGSVRQKDQTPTTSVCGGKFDTTALNWNKQGALPATLNGSPTLSEGKLVCTGAQGVSYAVNRSGKGAIKVKYTPNYTTAPPENVNVVALAPTTGNNDRVVLTHSPSGNTLRITLNNSSGAAVIGPATSIGSAWEPTAGITYEIELNWDNVAGVVRVFIDGTLHGTLTVSPWTSGTSTTRLSVGATPNIYDRAQGSFDDILYFNAVQHTSSYTAGYTVSTTIYASDFITAPTLTYTGLGSVQSFDNISISEGSGAPRYILNGLYWDGSAWVASGDSYATASSKADVEANISTLPASDTLTIDVVTDSTNTQASVSNISITYTGQIYPTDNPTILTNDTISTDAISAFAAVESVTGSDLAKFTIVVDGQDKYWNGSAWADSAGTYAQSNTETEINTNISSLDISTGADIQVRIFMHSDDGSTTPTLDSVTITTSIYGGDATTPTQVVVYGYVYDPSGQPISGVSVSATLMTNAKYSDKIIKAGTVTTTTVSSGYWELTLVETGSATNTNFVGYNFTFSGIGPNAADFSEIKKVPSAESINYSALSNL